MMKEMKKTQINPDHILHKLMEDTDMWEQTASVSTRKTMKNDKENSFLCVPW